MRSTRETTPVRQGVVRFGQQQRVLAAAEHALELPQREQLGIRRLDQPIRRVVLPDLRREPGARREQQGVKGNHPDAAADDPREGAGGATLSVHCGQGPSTSTDSIWGIA